MQKKSNQGRDTHTPVFLAASFTIAEGWKQSKCPLTDEWINKMGYIHTMGYYSVFNRKGNLTHAASLKTFC